MSSRFRLSTHAGVLIGYFAVAIAFAWPLPLHLQTHLTGPPTGDTGVYVWNQWVFQHESLAHGRLPYFTDAIFSLTGADANLSLHNYTPFQNALALPLIPLFGVVATFNIVLLAMHVLTAYVTFLLARRVTGGVAESWLAGVLFAWSPVLVTRATGHFSLVAAAPLAAFLLLLTYCDDGDRRCRGAWLGAAIAWAASTDVYYGIYCLLIGALFIASRSLRLTRVPAAPRPAVRLALDGLVLALAALVAVTVATGGGESTWLGVPIRVRSLYTPVLALTLVLLIRLGLRTRVALADVSAAHAGAAAAKVVVAGLTAAVLLSPLLYAFAVRVLDGRFDAEPIYWRSSPRGADVLALLTPNPNHPMAPDWLRGWLMPQSAAYLENVASLSWVALALLAVARLRGWRAPRWWTGLTVAFGLLALGPFVHAAGVNLYVPGPWAVLRYVPVIGLARTPTRFTVMLTLVVAVLAASALTWLGRQAPGRRRVLVAGAGLLLCAELWSAPRPIYSAAIPRIYATVAAEPGDLRVLQLPFGIRDGTSSVGNFNARTMYFQTAHGKPLVGGYLSRVSNRRRSEVRGDDTLDALIVLSEGGRLAPDREARLYDTGPAFVRRARLGFVVIDRADVDDAFAALVVRAFRLEFVEREGLFELYRPTFR